MSEAVPLVNNEETKFSANLLEALKHYQSGKRSKQRFLKVSSRDDIIVKARKGSGGNTVTYKSSRVTFVMKQLKR